MLKAYLWLCVWTFWAIAAKPRLRAPAEGIRLLDFAFPLDSIYEHMGTGINPQVCIYVETLSQKNVSIGGYQQMLNLGTFPANSLVPLNKKAIEQALQFEDKSNATELTFHVTARFERSFSYNLQKCHCPRVTAPLAQKQLQYSSVVTCQPEMDNYGDRFQQFHIFMEGMKVTKTIDLRQSLLQAVHDPHKTICIRYQGQPLLHMRIKRCEMEETINIVAGSDYIYGIDKDALKRLHSYECKYYLPEWSIDVYPTSDKSGKLSLEIFGCSKHKDAQDEEAVELDKAFPAWIPDTDWQNHDQKYYFSLQPPKTGEDYSADLKSMIDTAMIGGKNAKIRMDLKTNVPVNLSIKRCKEDEGVPLNTAKSGVYYLDHAQLVKLIDASLQPKCEHEADDSLYIRIEKTNSAAAEGSVSFSMSSENEQKLVEKEVAVAFAMPANSSFVRRVNLIELVNEAVLNERQVGFDIKSSEFVQLFVSKCRRSEQVILAGHVNSGERKPSLHVFQKIAELFEETCDEMDRVEEGDAFLHIVSTYGEAIGNIKFFRSGESIENNGTRPTPFVDLKPELTASSDDEFVNFNHQDIHGDHPVEIDLLYFLKTVMSYPYMDLIMELDSQKPVNLTFSKCKYLSSKNVTIAVDNNKIVRLEDVESLYDLIMTKRCDNTAKYGLFVHVDDWHYQGIINFYLENFRAMIPHNGGKFEAKNNSAHVVKIPIGNMEHAISIRLSNYNQKPVQMSLSMCSLNQESVDLPNVPTTFAYLVLDIDDLAELKENSKNCSAPLNDVMLLTIKSEDASGRITIDRLESENCDNCSKGGIEFFRNSTGLTIAQCVLDSHAILVLVPTRPRSLLPSEL
ncbi:hypothetical protein GCK72_025768 [Caenorhabditis remanei]|uniref:Uncharacterized protein n=1 Tax=Caenorhabditis remanei TaxID=31234 RepID=A0A6A5G3K3_CAERE|nr:hypothetical protein GCK72_025768 [Caenorhabditis remanei]KAF1749301.1 hypothetical protein GCK72_025768 [Caenorhabditis remanei]